MEILRIKVTVDGCHAIDTAPRGVRMLPFSGGCEGPFFQGVILPGGVDTQFDLAPGQGTLSARYMLKGTDDAGKACQLFIDNSAVTRAGSETVTHPRIITDSASLKWLETAALTGRIEDKGDHLEIVISAERSPSRQAIELTRAGLTLRGVLDRPDNGPCPLVLMLHGFGGRAEEGEELSNRLTAAGLATLRFDFNGHGQSDGSFTDMTPFNELEDATAFLRYAQSLDSVTDIYVVGHSQGGVIAGMLAGYYHDAIRRMVLLAPAASLKTDAQAGRCMRATYDPQRIPERVNVDGIHEVGGLYFRMAQTLPIYEVTRQFEGPGLIVFGKQDQVVSLDAARRYLDGAKNRELALYDTIDHGLQGAEHAEMMDHVTNFLKKPSA